MLRGLHKASSTWLGKAVMAGLFGFLILSFGLWGIGDIFRGFGRSTVAQIGSTEIGIEQYQQTYNDRLQQLGRSLGKPITQDQARALGLPQQLLGTMVAEAAIDEEARRMRLNLSDAEIARLITNDSSFRGPAGQFDKLRFDQLIRTAGYSEQRYAQEQRRLSLRRQITNAVSGDPIVPKTAADLSDRFQNEQRAIDYVVLGRAQAGTISPPTPEELTKYFDGRKILFRAPEYRKIVTLAVSPNDIARGIEVANADARRTYDENRSRYGNPERRQVQQIVFPNMDEAKAAADRLAKGETFEAIANERGLKSSDVDLGLVTKSGMIDQAVAGAAFALTDGATSTPIAGRFGATLVRVTKIEPEHIKPFEEVESDIKQAIATERAKPEMLNLRDKIEDDRAAGSHLDEIARKYKLPSQTIEAVDRSGRNPNGKPITGIPAGVDLVGSAFASDVGVDNDPLQASDGTTIWFDVAGVTPSHDRPLEEVKDAVIARWTDDQIAQRLSTKTKDMIDKLKAGASLADLARTDGLKVETTFGLKRNATQPLPAQAVEAIFRTPKDTNGDAGGQSPQERVVFRVTDITEPVFDASSADGQRYTETWRRALSEDLFAQYVQRVETDLGTTVNQDAVARVLGLGEPN